MPTVDVKNLKNESVGQLELSDDVFGAPLNEALIYDAVRNYLTNQRQGTVKTKTRGNVSGSGKKLWKQKGTGRAYRQSPFATVEGGRKRPRTTAARLDIRAAEEDEARRAQLCSVGASP